MEAANGRGEFKADFTDKILALVGKMVEPVVDAGNVVLPGVPALVKKSAESIINKVKELVGAPLSLTFPKLNAENIGFFSPRSSSSPQPAFIVEPKGWQPA